MKIRDLTELAGRNLREALLRNSLTTLGIAVGVASLVAMLSLGVGLQDLANQRLSRSGLFDAIIVAPRTNFRGFGRPARLNPLPPGSGTMEPPRPLDEDARQAIEHLANVIEVYPEIRFPTEIRFKGNPYSTIVAGVPMSARSGGAFDGMNGVFFSGPAADEAILQIEFARQLSPQPDTLAWQGDRAVVRGAPGASAGTTQEQFRRESNRARLSRSRSFARLFRCAARGETAHRGNRRNGAGRRIRRRRARGAC